VNSLKRILFFLILFYIAIFVWPTRWRYDHMGATPIRWDRVTYRMQFCNLHGWQTALPPIGGDPDDAPYEPRVIK
jgi:hypothetical protein